GRFISADTVQGNALGADPYAYVGGNPETLNDPTGQCPWCVVGAIAGFVAGASIDYGWQVYQNYQHGSANPWTNVNWMQVGGAGVAGGLIGLTMGAAATVVGAGAAGAGAAASAEAAATTAGGAELGGAETTAAAATVSSNVEATAATAETTA